MVSLVERLPFLGSFMCDDISTVPYPCRCASDVLGGVDKLLQHVTSVKAINSIKSAIHSLLATPTGEGSGSDSTPWAEQWAGVCQLIVNKKLSIWETFFQPVLLQRVKVLLDCSTVRDQCRPFWGPTRVS